MRNNVFEGKGKQRLKRSVSLLLAVLAACNVWMLDGGVLYASEYPYAAAKNVSADAVPLAVDQDTGEAKNAFALGETFHITGTKSAAAIRQAEVWYQGVKIASQAVSASGTGISYDIPVKTTDLGLAEEELNQSRLFTVRFVCSDGTEENVEIELAITAEAKMEKDGNVTYLGKLEDAFADFSGDGNITLLSDIDAKNPLFGGMYLIRPFRTYVIDLNNHDMKVTGGDAVFSITNDVELTIKGEGNIEFCESSGMMFYMQTDGITLNIEGGEFKAEGPIIETSYKKNNKINISGGTFTSTGARLFFNWSSAGSWISLKDMPAPGYCFVDAQDQVIEVGEGTVMFTKDVGFSVTVRKIDFARDAVVEIPALPGSYIYNGYEKRPEVKSVAIAGVKMKEGEDYRVDYENNIGAGEASVIISGVGSIYSWCGRKTLNFTIDRGKLQLEGTGTASGVYGTKTSDLEISGFKVLAGGWEFPGTFQIDDDRIGGDTLLDAGESGPYRTVFIPESGAENYETLTGEVMLSIRKAEGILTVPEAEVKRPFSQEGFSLHCSTNGDGAISYVSDQENVAVVSREGTVTAKGVGTAVLTVSLAEGKNYTGGKEQAVTVSITKGAAPVISPETKKYVYTAGSKGPVRIGIADKLPENAGEVKYTVTAADADGILSDISVDSAGMLTYTVKGNQTAGNTASLTVTAEMENYEDAIVTVNIEISEKNAVGLQAGSSVSISGGSLTYGQTLSDLALNPAVFTDQETKEVVEGTLAWKKGSDMPDAGTIAAEWIFTPDNQEKYLEVTGTIPVTVKKATPHVEAPQTDAVTYHPSKTLDHVRLSGGNATWTAGGRQMTVEGDWSWKDASAVPTVGNSGYIAVFTPKDDANYTVAMCTVTLTVEKALPYVAVPPKAAKIASGDTLSASALTGGAAQYSANDKTAVKGRFAWKDAAVRPTVPDSGNTRYAVTFIPLDTANYANAETEITLLVEQKASTTPSAKISKKQKEKNGLKLNMGIKISQTGNKITVAWGKVSGASGYDVYVQYCGKKFTSKSRYSVKSGKKTKLTVKKVNGKKLDLKKNYRAYVLAYQMVNGKKITLGKSITVHAAGRKSTKYTNVKTIKLKKSSYSLKKGKTAAIKASCILADKKKKQLSDAHAKQFRYVSSNKSVATVTEKGKIKAVGKGSCAIYVYAKNGYAKKVKVEVK